jgi:hypothetical protein
LFSFLSLFLRRARVFASSHGIGAVAAFLILLFLSSYSYAKIDITRVYSGSGDLVFNESFSNYGWYGGVCEGWKCTAPIRVYSGISVGSDGSCPSGNRVYLSVGDGYGHGLVKKAFDCVPVGCSYTFTGCSVSGMGLSLSTSYASVSASETRVVDSGSGCGDKSSCGETSGSAFGSCSIRFSCPDTATIPLPPCSDPYPISAPACKGGIGLWGIGKSIENFPGMPNMVGLV